MPFLRLTAIAILVTVSAVAAPSTALAYDEGEIQVTPTAVSAGEQIHITGSCGTPGTWDVSFTLTDPTGTPDQYGNPPSISHNGEADDDGLFDTIVQLPQAISPGEHSLSFSCHALDVAATGHGTVPLTVLGTPTGSPAPAAVADFTVTPLVGNPGDQLSISGTCSYNGQPGDTVSVNWIYGVTNETSLSAFIGDLPVANDGTAAGQVTIPTNAHPWDGGPFKNQVWLSCKSAGWHVASQSVDITLNGDAVPEFTLNLATSEGRAGETVAFSGVCKTGSQPGDLVSLSWSPGDAGIPAELTPLAEVTVNTDGTCMQ